MSQRFVGVMQDIIDVTCTTYGAETVAVVPGGGTYAMEAVARQLATGRRCLVVRNGLFSYRWSQILDAGSVASETTVCQARPGVRRAAGALDAGSGRRGGRGHRARPSRGRLRAARGDRGRHGAARRLRPRRRRGDARGGWALRPRLHRVRSALGGHDRARRRRPDQRPAEGVERLTVRRLRDARRGRPGPGHVHDVDQLRGRPQEVAGDHRGLRPGADAVPRHDADRHARARRRAHARDPRRRARRAASGPDLARHAGPRPARRARLPLARGRGVRRGQRGGGLHRRPRDPQRREVQAARRPGGRRRTADVRRGRRLLHVPGGASASTSSPESSTAPWRGSKRTSGTDLLVTSPVIGPVTPPVRPDRCGA